MNEENKCCAEFNYSFPKKYKKVKFSFCYPYSWRDLQADILSWSQKFHNHANIYFFNECLTLSLEKREIYLLTISSFSNIERKKECYPIKTPGQPSLPDLPFDICNPFNRALKFENRKPVIFLSARVHPGETPASFAIRAAIEFLLSEEEEARILREKFVFKIVPMLNPDGVFNGHFRTDRLLQNLNRHYNIPNEYRHSICLAMVQILKYFSENDRLIFFCDYHAHPSIKSCFFYGNFSKFERDIESRAFALFLKKKTRLFSYKDSIFSLFQMKAKEKNKKTSKEGCSRVMALKICGVAHSYTLELPYFDILDQMSGSRISPATISNYEEVGVEVVRGLIKIFLPPSEEITDCRWQVGEELSSIYKGIKYESKESLEKYINQSYYTKNFVHQFKFLRQSINQIENDNNLSKKLIKNRIKIRTKPGIGPKRHIRNKFNGSGNFSSQSKKNMLFLSSLNNLPELSSIEKPIIQGIISNREKRGYNIQLSSQNKSKNLKPINQKFSFTKNLKNMKTFKNQTNIKNKIKRPLVFRKKMKRGFNSRTKTLSKIKPSKVIQINKDVKDNSKNAKNF